MQFMPLAPQYFINGFNDVVDVLVGQFGRQGNGDRPVRDELGIGKVPSPVSVARRIVRMQVCGDIVDASADFPVMQCLKNLVASFSRSIDVH